MKRQDIKALLKKHRFRIIETTPSLNCFFAVRQTDKEACSLICTILPSTKVLISVAFDRKPHLRKAEKLMKTLFGDRFQRDRHEMDGKNAHYFTLLPLN